MKLPVRPKDSWEIIDAEDNRICLMDTTEQRDYIVHVLNNYEKLVDVIDEIEAVSCGEKQIESDGVYDDSDGMLWIYKRIQALNRQQPREKGLDVKRRDGCQVYKLK